MGEKIRLIEYQGRQRTPGEVLEFMQDEIEKGECTHLVVIYRDDKTSGYVPGSIERGYTSADILWDVEQWKHNYLKREVG